MLKNLNFIILLLILTIMLTPILNRNIPRFIEIGVFGMWFFTMLFTKTRKWWKKYSALLFIVIIWQCLEFLYRFIGVSTADWGNYLLGLFAYFLLIIGLFVHEQYNLKQKKILVFYIIGVLLFSIFDNIRLNAIYQGATNNIYREWASDLLKLNVAETGFYGTIMLTIGAILIYFTNLRSSYIKYFIMFSILSSLYFCFLITPRATSCIFIMLEVFYISVKRWNKVKICYFLMGLLLPLVCICAAPLISMIFSSDEIGEGFSRVSERFSSIQSLFEGNKDDDSSFGARLNLTFLSINTFIESPSNFLFGIGHHVGEYGEKLGIGQHTRYADVLANYGIIGATILFTLTYRFYQCFKQILYKEWNLWKILFIVYILYGCFEHNRNVGMITILCIFVPSIFALGQKSELSLEK